MNHFPTRPDYWRSLEQLAANPVLRNHIQSEFPTCNPHEIPSRSRRHFLKLAAASMALAGLTLSGCRRWPREQLAPYTGNHPNPTPGELEQYTTVLELSGVAMPLLATSFDGRPIKIEGNPSHPFSKTAENYGAADALAQASVLELYDPERSRFPVDRTAREPRPATWEDFTTFAATHFATLRDQQGATLAILAESATGPSFAYMKKSLLQAFPKAKWYEYEPLTRDNEILGSKLAFNDIFRPSLHLDKAATVVLFDANILGHHPAHIRYAADWATRRRSADQGQMSRVYIAESAFTTTGTAADIRLPARPARIELMLQALAAKLAATNIPALSLPPDESHFIDAAAADLKNNPAAGLVAVGSHLAPSAHALAHAINLKLGAVGTTIDYLDQPLDERPSHLEAITALTNDISANRVQTLLILGGNPAYDAPADLDFPKALAAIPTSIHLSLYNNETSLASKWHLPRAHYLESWSDARAYDFTISIAQPLILPLYNGKSIIELLAILASDPMTDGEQIVRRTFVQLLPKQNFEINFRRVLHDGILADSASNSLKPDELKLQSLLVPPQPTPPPGFDIRFLPSPALYDGRFANNGWLQETPDPLTKLTWDNAALISPYNASQLQITTGDILTITLNNRSLSIPAFVLPGQPQGVIGLPLGYGRGAAGNIGNAVGADTYRLRTSTAFFTASGAKIQKTGRRYELAITQDHHTIDIDKIADKARTYRLGHQNQSGILLREATFAEYLHNKNFVRQPDQDESAKANQKVHLSLYDPPAPIDTPHKWGMAIDMNSCTGCNACVVACQAENNIPVVGKTQVLRQREMHWIRNDRYFKGHPDNPTVTYQPLMCVQCENAPCEEVCPVAATVHDSEGLNTQVYNRCIGTRYCSNNCPYKVRRFNYLDYHSQDPRGKIPRPYLNIPDTQQKQQVDQIKRMAFNPDVTVRMRGVMEKCTYCVQRIHRANIHKRNLDQPLADGDIITACQQACPTQAIIFGDLNDPASNLSQLHNNPRAYPMLQLLDTRPRTRHLAKLRNTPDPETRNPKPETRIP